MASEQQECVLFRACEEEAADFFCHLNPKTELRLALLEGDSLYVIYSEWKGQKEILEEIANQASIRFQVALCFGYYSAVGYVCELYEHGQLTRHDEDGIGRENNWGTTGRFQPFGYPPDNEIDALIETKVIWRNNDWLLEHTPSADRWRRP